MDAFADLDRRLRRVREIPVAAILHPDLHLVARRLAHRMLYTIAREPATNLMPVTIELVREGASMGEIVEKLKTLWGTYRETPVF